MKANHCFHDVSQQNLELMHGFRLNHTCYFLSYGILSVGAFWFCTAILFILWCLFLHVDMFILYSGRTLSNNQNYQKSDGLEVSIQLLLTKTIPTVTEPTTLLTIFASLISFPSLSSVFTFLIFSPIIHLIVWHKRYSHWLVSRHHFEICLPNNNILYFS